MTGESLQKIKLLRIVEMLKQESSEQRPLCTNEIVEKAAEMGVSFDRRMLSIRCINKTKWCVCR